MPSLLPFHFDLPYLSARYDCVDYIHRVPLNLLKSTQVNVSFNGFH